MPLNTKYLSYSELDAIADKFLTEHWNPNKIPVDIALIADRDFRLHIFPTDGLRSIGEDSFLASDFTAIYVDRYIYDNVVVRFNFSVCHEVCHYLLHADIIGSYKYDSVDEYKSVYFGLDDGLRARMNWQADQLAGRILIPKAAIMDDLTDWISANNEKIEEALASPGVSDSSASNFFAYLAAAEYSNAYDVSNDAYKYRILNDDDLTRLFW